MTNKKIPIAEPLMSGKEKEYVLDCINKNWISSKGDYVRKFEDEFSKYCNVKHAVSTTSGTTALHLCLESLGIKHSDEVIMPSFTMAATVFSIIYSGAKPIFIDSEPITWNLDVEKLEGMITDKTKAIIVVHTYGHPADMDPINDLAEDYELHVIEDAAEAHGAEYKGQKTGSLGDVACFSFYANKIITTGEGGMIITDNEEIAENARMLGDMAFIKEKRFFHPKIGFNYRMTNLQAAVGLAQLENIGKLIEIRRKNAQFYNSLLKDIEGLTLPPELNHVKNVYWMYSVLVTSKFKISRDNLMDKLAKYGIETRNFFIPMHKQPIFPHISGKYPVAENLSDSGINLPSGATLQKDEIRYIVNKILE
jgi:perosamine synthetase|tara:strand:+ start:9895 stop:10992 length:1098 start_codon:yes stop_codon:yes gene_type:complete